MQLILQRSYHVSRTRQRTTYILDVTIDTTVEERTLIKEHDFGHNPLYAIPDIEEHRNRAADALERSDNRSLLRAADAPKLLADMVASLFQAVRARLGYVITVNDGLSGTRVMCPDIYQLLEAETAITAAFDELDRDVQNALAFTTGREQILVPETAEDVTDTHPADWADHHRWMGTR